MSGRKHLKDWAASEKADMISHIQKEILDLDKFIALIAMSPATREEAGRKEELLAMSREHKKYLESKLENIRKLSIPE